MIEQPREGSEFVRHEPCPSCGSRNNLARYSDGHAYCFSFGCGHYERSQDLTDERTVSAPSKDPDSPNVQGEFRALPSRNLREDTCQLWGYRCGEYKDRPAQFAYYFGPETRQPVAAKVRFSDKTFTFIGNPKEAPLYGQWLWRDAGKMIVVVEGEIDALSVSQIQGNKWPVVSVQNGAQGAVKSVRKAIDYLNRFDTVVFMFDMDEPGRAAAIECAKLLPPGKAKIASLPLKDANDMLRAGRGAEVIDAIWGARAYRPDGIVSLDDVWESAMTAEAVPSVSYPWEGLTNKTSGIRKRELVTITAGSGIGKSLLCREIAYDLIANKNWKVGYIALEENPRRTVLGIAGVGISRPLRISLDGVDADDIHAVHAQLKDRLYMYDSFGSVSPDNLLERLRYMAVGLQCDVLILDHISIAISGLEDIDERRTLDVMMTKLRSLVEETGVAMFIVSHLKRPNGDKGHEEGAVTSLAQLRGSHAIAQLSDIVLGVERNQQGEAPNEVTIRVLKNRFSGDTGVATTLHYNKETGRLLEGVEGLLEVQGGEAEF